MLWLVLVPIYLSVFPLYWVVRNQALHHRDDPATRLKHYLARHGPYHRAFVVVIGLLATLVLLAGGCGFLVFLILFYAVPYRARDIQSARWREVVLRASEGLIVALVSASMVMTAFFAGWEDDPAELPILVVFFVGLTLPGVWLLVRVIVPLVRHAFRRSGPPPRTPLASGL